MAGAGMQDLSQAITRTAWQHIAANGAAALSLRAIARELGITAPAIYNYYRRRDDLVTALIVDAFTSFGDAQVAALDGVPTSDWANGLRALGVAYRGWAITHPQHCELLWGAPVPGSTHAPEPVARAGEYAIGALAGLVRAMREAGALRVVGLPDAEGSEPERTVTLIIWARVHGLVSIELYGKLPPLGTSAQAVYDFEIESLVRQYVAVPAIKAGAGRERR